MFQDKVYALCKKIPKGRVSTYKEIAESFGCKAYRAVGQVLNKNPYKEVPCHRVVDSKGNLHGFALGLKKKKEMLEKEGIKIRNYKILDFEKVLYHLK